LDAHANQYCYTHQHTYAYIDEHANRYANQHADAYTDQHAHADTCHTCRDIDAHGDGSTYSDVHADGGTAYTYRDVHTDGDTRFTYCDLCVYKDADPTYEGTDSDPHDGGIATSTDYANTATGPSDTDATAADTRDG